MKPLDANPCHMMGGQGAALIGHGQLQRIPLAAAFCSRGMCAMVV